MATGRIKVKESDISGTTLPVIGYLSIGEVSKPADPNKKGYPKSLNHFRVRGKNNTPCLYESEFTRVFGDKPTRIPIAFISDDLKEVCNQQYENWDNGKNWGSGDGETFKVWDTTAINKTTGAATGAFIEVDSKHHLVQQWKREGKWKERLTMTFVIPKITSVLGVWKFQTGGSKSSIPEIVKAFDWIKEKASTVKYFPFDLIVESHVGKNPGEAKQWKIVKLIPSAGQESLQSIRQMFSSGRMNELGNTALFVLSDSDIKQIAESAPQVQTIDNTPQIESKPVVEQIAGQVTVEQVAEEIKEPLPTVVQDAVEALPEDPKVPLMPLPGMENDEKPVVTTTPSLKGAGKKSPGLFQ